MDKLELLTTIRTTHAEIEAAVGRLRDDELLAAAPAMEGWTRKDVVAHLEWWSDHSARVVAALCAGREPYDRSGPFDIDLHNARLLAESRSRALDDVRRGEAEAYRRVVAAVEAASDEDLFDAGRFAWLGGDALVATVAADTAEHYQEHLPQFAAG